MRASIERLECRQLLAGTPGLTVSAYHLGGGNSNANDALFGGTNAALVRVANFAATNAPNYTFVDTKDAFNFSGDSGAMTPAFLGDDAAGAALTDTDNQNDTIYDAEGFFVAPTAGTYTFSIGNGANNQADDICGIYVGGNGTAGSGTLVAADGWQGATSPFSVDPTNTPGTATFMLPAGNIPMEIIYGNGGGGAFLNGVSITDPTMAQVAYVTSGTAPAPQVPVLNTPSSGDGQVTLSWNSGLFATSYSVFRSDPAHPTAASIASGVTGTTYTDKSVTVGVSYTYYVQGTDSSGTSPPSNAQTVTATAGAATPLNLTARRVGGTASVGLSWTAAPNALASTTYDVKRGTSLNGDGTLGGTIVDVTPGGVSTTSAIDSNAVANTTYYYAVSATDAGGTSAPSTAVKLSAVSPVATVLASEGTVEVDVRAVDLPSGPANFWANEAASGGAFTPFGTAAPTVGTFADSNGVTFQAVNFNGSTALTSSFNAPADLTGNSARSIEVWVLNPTIDTIEETMVSWAHRGGPDGTNESFSYGSTYAVGEWGGEFDMTWAGSAASGAPTTAPAANVWHNLTFTYDGNLTEDVYVDGQLQLTGASNGMPLATQLTTAVGLPINLAAQNNAGVAAILGSLDVASVRISGGALTAADVLQNFKAGVPGQTLPASAPTAPVLAKPVTSSGVVQLNWGYVGDAGTGFGYNVFRSDPAHPTAAPIASGLMVATYTDKSVTDGVSYTYYVEAVNSSGASPPSNMQTVTAIATPATPLNFSASRVGGTTNVALSWKAAPNAPASTTYDVKRGTSLNGDGTLGGTIVDITPGGASAISATDTNAATNTTYYYDVTSTDAGGTSAPSAAIKVSAVSPIATVLASEGTVEVDVRAIDLPAGAVNSWTNEGASGGAFTPFATAAPTVGDFTDSNGVTYQAVNFNGSTAVTSSFLAPADLTGNSARSIEVWVLNPTIDGVEETMVSWAHRGGPDGTNESFSYGGTYGVGEWGGEFDMTWAGSAAAGAPTTAPPANIWHNLTFTYDGMGTEDVYVDGQLQLTGASNGMQNIGQLATAVGFPINLAAQNNAGAPASIGSLDIASVRVSGGALTAADVLQNFKAGVPGQTPPTVAPAAGPVLAKPVVNSGLVQLSWSYVGDSGTGFGYNVFRSDAAQPNPVAIASNLTATSYTDTTVTNGVQYTYTVVAKNSADSGPASNSQTATPTPLAPATPTNFTASRIEISSNVAMSWTASQFATSYDVKRGTALNPDGTLGGTITDLTQGGITGTSFTDTSAPITSDAYYTVTASNVGGSSAPTTPALVAKLTAATGLEDFAYHLGGGNSNAFNNVFGGDNAALNRVASFAATNAPNYSFLNSATAFMYSGGSGAMTAAFLGNDASGAALTDTFNQNDTIYDAEGYFVAPTAGTYTFQIGNGSNNQADDICGIYVGGNGTPGSGTLVAADGWQGATSPFGTNAMTPGIATFTLPSGNIPVEIIYGNGFGGAFLDGVSITDPTSKQVAYMTLATASFQDVISGTPGNDAITLKKDADGTDIDWTLNGGPAVKASASDLTIIGNGGTDTITLDSSNGSPVPAMLHLNQSTGGRFIIAGLTQTSGYKMDIENSTVQINYSGASPLSSIQANLKSGAIFSSTLASAKFGVADTDSADPLNVGQPANTIVLRPALIGNATLSGKVGFADLVQLARNYNKTNADWAMGDFDYSGKVDFADLVALARNYGASAAVAGAASAIHAAVTPEFLSPPAAIADGLHKTKASRRLS